MWEARKKESCYLICTFKSSSLHLLETLEMKAPHPLSVCKTLHPIKQGYCLQIFHKSRHPDTCIINLDENWHYWPLLGGLASQPGEKTFEVFNIVLMLGRFCQRESFSKGSDSMSHFLFITIPSNHLAILPIGQAGNVRIIFHDFLFLLHCVSSCPSDTFLILYLCCDIIPPVF